MKNEERKNQRKEAILNAFQALIAQYGVDKTTMQEIADSVGISVGTLYNEFADKEALIDALVDRVEISLKNKISTLKFTSDAPDEQLAQLLTKIIDFLESVMCDYRSLADYMLSGSQKFRYVGKKIHQDFQEGGVIIARIRSIIQSGVDRGVFDVDDVEMTALAITRAFTTYSLARFLMNPEQEKVAQKSWTIWFQLLVRGLMKRSE